MDYTSRVLQSPKPLRTSQDRFCLTPNKTSYPKFNLTPERTPPIPKIPLSPNNRISLSQDRFRSPRTSISSPMLHCQSQEVFSSPRRSSIKRDSSLPSSPSTSKKRIFPSNPANKIEIDDMQNDYYINPMDWSRRDIIGMGLSVDFALINPKTSEITILDNAPSYSQSVRFNNFGNIACLGSSSGILSFYDIQALQPLHSMHFTDRAFDCCDWEENTVFLGNDNGNVALVDFRDKQLIKQFSAHFEEVCQIKVNPFNKTFATGCNDTRIKIWDQRNLDSPITIYEEHNAAIRAITWSPHDEAIIATGGGNSDKLINLWNSQTGETLHSIDTQSQVCNLFWNEEYNEIVSSHGYTQNQIAFWKGTDLSPIASINSHLNRILYMAHSHDETSIATAAPNDSLQIWKVFPQRQLTMSESLLLIR